VSNESAVKTIDTPDSNKDSERDVAEIRAALEGGEEEEEECAFCKFMKGGGCRDQFIAWEECVAEAKQTGDFLSKCAEITEALQMCMNAPENKEYYQLFLDDQEEYVQEHKEKEGAEG
jgi:mitochondrial intermembrane space import and assembly protein 40